MQSGVDIMTETQEPIVQEQPGAEMGHPEPELAHLHAADSGFPEAGSAADKLKFLLQFAVLAPSAHNTQPWLFKLRDEDVELWLDLSRAMPHCDPGNRELVISCGAALFQLRVALRRFGYRGK